MGILNSTKPSSGFVIAGVYTAQGVAPVDGQGCALQVDNEGNLLVNNIGGGGGGGGTVTQGPQGSIASPWFTELTIDGTNVAGTPTHPLRIDPTGTTIQPISGTVQPGNTPNTVPWLVSNVPSTTGGASDFHLVSAGSTNANVVKNSSGQLYGWSVFNNAAYPIFVKFYNQTTSPTPGTGVVQTVAVQAGVSVELWLAGGRFYSTGIGLTVTKGIADSDATAVLANDCVLDIFYI